jgi:hypothetical protein
MSLSQVSRLSFIVAGLSIGLTALSACSLQDHTKKQAYLEQNKASPVVNACTKVKALFTEYSNNFDRIKEDNIHIKNSISKIWRAKYHLVGNSCQVWARGLKNNTYACSLIAPDEAAAINYFTQAKLTTEKCLGSSWDMVEADRNNNRGKKITFSQAGSALTLSTHMVPTAGLFKSEWTVYYYVGNTL